MLKLAAQYQDLLRQHNINPEEVTDIRLDHNHPGAFVVDIQPRSKVIPINVEAAKP